MQQVDHCGSNCYCICTVEPALTQEALFMDLQFKPVSSAHRIPVLWDGTSIELVPAGEARTTAMVAESGGEGGTFDSFVEPAGAAHHMRSASIRDH